MFRAYNRVSKQIYNHSDLLHFIKSRRDDYDPFSDKHLVIDMAYQFKDSLHNFIYENDIIETSETKTTDILYVVQQGQAYAFYKGKFKDRHKTKAIPKSSLYLIELQKMDNIKVIGNIHINLDLLGV